MHKEIVVIYLSSLSWLTSRTIIIVIIIRSLAITWYHPNSVQVCQIQGRQQKLPRQLMSLSCTTSLKMFSSPPFHLSDEGLVGVVEALLPVLPEHHRVHGAQPLQGGAQRLVGEDGAHL